MKAFTIEMPIRIETMATPDKARNHLVFVAVPESATSAGVARFRSAIKYRCIMFSIKSQMPATNGVRIIKLNFGLILLILNTLATSKLKNILYQIG